MIKIRSIILFALTISLLTSLNLIADEKKDKLLDEFYIKSGLEEQLKHLPEVFKLNLDQQTALVDKSQGILKEYYESTNDLLNKSFDSSKIGASIKSDLKKEISSKDINLILDFLKTPTGEKVTQLEIDATKAVTSSEFNKYLSTLSSNPIPESRLNLLSRLSELIDVLDFTTEMTINMQFAITAAITYTLPSELTEDKISLTKIKQKLDDSKPLIKSALEPVIIYTLNFTYKDLTENELKQYITFYENDVAQNFNKVFIDSYLKAITRASFDFGQRSAEFIKTRQQQEQT